MEISNIENAKAQFPFKIVKGDKGIKFRQQRKRGKEGVALVVEHNGHDHVVLDFRELYKTTRGGQGDKRILRWEMDTRATVQFASVLMYLVEERMRDSAESPYVSIVTTKEKAEFGVNWINEDYDTAISRINKRKSRSHMFGLMKRFVECCTEDEIVQSMALNLGIWARNSGDEFAMQQAEKMFFQLGMVPDKIEKKGIARDV